MRLLLDTHIFIWGAMGDSRLGKRPQSSGFIELPVHSTHAVRVRNMPYIHRDPFDRIRIAQAIGGPLHLMTKDRKLAAYSHLVITV